MNRIDVSGEGATLGRKPRTIAALGEAELPEPPSSLWPIIGPGIAAAGVGLGSSEFILFPFIASQVGLGFLWAAVLGVTLQFFLNMEIERYTLATGETVLTGFSRLSRHFGLVMVIMALMTGAWPGWAATSGTLVTYMIGGDATLIAIAMMVLAALMLTFSRVVFWTLERTLALKIGLTAVLFGIALLFAIPGDAALEGARRAISPVLPVEALGWSVILGAIAFAGMGGAGNLCQSNLIRDKGFGMGAHAPRIVSPLLGEPVAAAGTGWRFAIDAESLRRWRAWWRLANVEQLTTFFAISILTIGFTSLLAFALLRDQPNLPEDIGFLRVQGEVLGGRVGSWFGIFFWGMGAFALFGTAIGILDIVSRLSADVIHTTYGRGRSESFVYMLVVWTLALFGIAALAAEVAQPLVLIVLSACVAGFAWFLYAPLLLVLNLSLLPKELRPGPMRIAALVTATLVFGAASFATIADQIRRFG